MDICKKTDNLNGELKEEIYMELPPGYGNQKGDEVCLKLRKSIYGLKQSPREWYACLTNFLQNRGLQACPFDPCVFSNIMDITTANEKVIMAVYVDDITLYGSNEAIAALTKQLRDRVNLSEAGKLHYLLGIQISISSDGEIALSQRGYVDKILHRFGMSDCKPQKVPLSPDHGLRKWREGDEPADQKLYQQIIGCLIYLVTGTRPDIAYVTMLLSQYASQPNTKHMGAAKRVLRYLQCSRDQKLRYTPSQDDNAAVELVGYADSDFANDKDDRKSISGYIFCLNGNTISWRAKKRGTVATSTTEAELYAMSFAAKHLSWIKEGLSELGYEAKKATLNGDNQSTLTLIKSQKINDLTKHVAVTYHHIRNLVLEQNRFSLQYVPSSENLADIYTKGLAREQYEKLRGVIMSSEA